MKHTSWAVAGLAALGVALVALLIPTQRPVETYWERSLRDQPHLLAAFTERQRLRWERGDVESAWRRTALRERARAVRAPGGPGLTLLFAPDVPATPRRSIERAAREELAAVGAEELRSRVVVLASVDAANVSGRYHRTVVLPTTPDGPCTVIVELSATGTGEAFVAPTDRLLGACAFFAAFGAPGAGMQRWLVETNLGGAGYLRPPPATVGDTMPIPVDPLWRADDLAARACRAGRYEACLDLFNFTGTGYPESWSARWAWPFVERDIAPTPELRSYGPTVLSAMESPLSSGLLGALADSMGHARFEGIWQGALPPAEEFERHEGRPLAPWVQAHLATRVAPYHAGPFGPALPALFSVALLLAAAAIAITSARRTMS